MKFNDYCPNCNRCLRTSCRCPICSNLESQHIELENGMSEYPNCLVCSGFSQWGGQYTGYPSIHDGAFICADCLAKIIDKEMEKIR